MSRSRFPVCAFVLLGGCASTPRTAGDAPPRATPPPAAITASVGTSAPTAPLPDDADAEALLKRLRAMADEGASPAKLDRFVTAHPALLTLDERPYGDALHWVLEFGEEQAALALIRAGANPGGDVVHLAARGCLDAVVETLLARGAPLNGRDYWGTPLHFAAKQGCRSTVELLLKAGADPNIAAEDHEFTPLHGAVIDRHTDVVAVLLRAGAALEAKDDDGRTALHWAGFAYRPQAVHEYPPDGGPHDTYFVDPGPATAMRLLLDAGASVDARDDDGDTPLHEAVRMSAPRAVKLLLAHGAKPAATNKARETPLSLARARGERAIEALLTGQP